MTQTKEYYCAHCGRKISALAARFLKGGQIVCTKCCKNIPFEILRELDRYDFKAFRRLRNEMEDMEIMRRNFRETAAYCGVRIDELHGWFIVSEYNRNMVFRFADLSHFQMDFVAENTHGGVFYTTVFGRMDYCMQVDFPYVSAAGTLSRWVTANGKTGRNLVPAQMDEFLNRFRQAWDKARCEKSYENVA